MRWAVIIVGGLGCAAPSVDDDASADVDTVDTVAGTDSAEPTADTDSLGDTDNPGVDADPFGDVVIAFTPGEAAGFGGDQMPGIVLGAPYGGGESAGSRDVVSLGRGGSIVLELRGGIVDGPGADLIVFENAFVGFAEPGIVAVSADGLDWASFPCAAEDLDGGFAGCAGVNPVISHPDNGVDPTDPTMAGGDPFDLADLGIAEARFVRITDADSSHSWYYAPSGGFDLDAVVAVHPALSTP